jgi:hypothetical protein
MIYYAKILHEDSDTPNLRHHECQKLGGPVVFDKYRLTNLGERAAKKTPEPACGP